MANIDNIVKAILMLRANEYNSSEALGILLSELSKVVRITDVQDIPNELKSGLTTDSVTSICVRLEVACRCYPKSVEEDTTECDPMLVYLMLRLCHFLIMPLLVEDAKPRV